MDTLPKDVLRLLLEFAVCQTTPSRVLIVSATCKLWRALLFPLYGTHPWEGFSACAAACDDFAVGEGMFKVFAWRRPLPKSAPVPEATEANRRMLEHMENWFSGAPDVGSEAPEQYDDPVYTGLHAGSVQAEMISGAFRWWNETRAADADAGLTFHADMVARWWNVVPHGRIAGKPGQYRQVGRAVCAGVMGYDAAYGQVRVSAVDSIEQCERWLDARLAELGTTIDDCEVYTSGDYWMPLRNNDDGKKHNGCGSGGFFSCNVTVTIGCVLVARNAVLVFASADED